MPAVQPGYAHHGASGHGQSTTPRRNTGLIVGIAIAAVLLVVAVVALAVVLVNRSDDNTAGGGEETSAPADPDATNDNGLNAREQEAADNIADELRAEPDISDAQADCIGVAMVKDVGLEEMIGEGLIDEDTLEPIDNDEADAELQVLLLSATFSCVLADD